MPPLDDDPALTTDASWSVLASPPADLPVEVHRALCTLGRERRSHLARTLGGQVIAEVERMTSPWFSPGPRAHARVDVYRARAHGRALRLAFVADHDNYNRAQAGSDWDDHYLFAGEATLDGGALAEVTFALARHVHTTEHAYEDYHPTRVRDLLRDALRACPAGPEPDHAAIDAELARVDAASVERARAANAGPPEVPRVRVATCPRCGSTRVHREPLFDSYQLACEACQHEESFEIYPDRESDDHWYP